MEAEEGGGGWRRRMRAEDGGVGWGRRMEVEDGGDAGLGKTELACALMAKVASSGAFHVINAVDRLKDVLFVPGQGLVVDGAC